MRLSRSTPFETASELYEQIRDISIKSEERVPWTATSLTRRRIANGDCLVSRPAKLGEAELVLVNDRLNRGTTPYGAGLNPLADTLVADRLEAYRRNGNHFERVYRWTGIVAYPHFYLFAPRLYWGDRFTKKLGFARRQYLRNIASRHYRSPDWSGFLIDKIGLDLSLRNADKALSRDLREVPGPRTLLKQALIKSGVVDPVLAKIAEDFYREVFFYDLFKKASISPGDADLAIQLIDDARFPLPDQGSRLTRQVSQLSDNFAARLARASFKRLTLVMSTELMKGDGRPLKDAERLGVLIGALPENAIQPYRLELEQLARLPRFRAYARWALAKLSAFGADAVPTLLFLLDGPIEGENKYDAGKTWDAGMTGLCRMGPAGGIAIPELLQRLRDGRLSSHIRYWRFTSITLLKLGADRDIVWQALINGNPAITREDFDKTMDRAMRYPPCTY